MYINKKLKDRKHIGLYIYIHVNHLLLSDINKLEKKCGMFLGTTSLRFVQSVVSRIHSTVVKNDATKNG